MNTLSKLSITRRNFLKLSGTAGATALLAACSPAAPDGGSGGGDGGSGDGRTIKIGLVGPITGPIAAFGEADEFTLDQVREVFADGIDIGGTVHPIEIILKDAESDSSRAAQVAQDLILNEEVDLLMAHATPDMVNPVAAQAEANGIPCITADAPWQPRSSFTRSWISMGISHFLGIGRYHRCLPGTMGDAANQQGRGRTMAQ